jgi:hypothetical protein
VKGLGKNKALNPYLKGVRENSPRKCPGGIVKGHKKVLP